MKKVIWIVSTVVVIAITIGALVLRSNTELYYRVLEYFFCPENNDFQVDVLEMQMYRLSQHNLKWLNKYGSVYNTRIGPETAEDILLNPEVYCVLEIIYSLENNSPSVKVKDLRLYPEFFSQEAMESIVAYDPMGSVATYVSVFPGEKYDHIQRLLIKCRQNVLDEFIEQFKQGKIKATFFTGNFLRDDGQKLYGPGMKEMEFPFEL